MKRQAPRRKESNWVGACFSRAWGSGPVRQLRRRYLGGAWLAFPPEATATKQTDRRGAQGVKTNEPATSTLSSGLGVPGGSSFFSSSQSGFRSAEPVAFIQTSQTPRSSHRAQIDPESLDMHPMRWPLVGKTADIVGSHGEFTAGYPDHFRRSGSIFAAPLCCDLSRGVRFGSR